PPWCSPSRCSEIRAPRNPRSHPGHFGLGASAMSSSSPCTSCLLGCKPFPSTPLDILSQQMKILEFVLRIVASVDSIDALLNVPLQPLVLLISRLNQTQTFADHFARGMIHSALDLLFHHFFELGR